ncbi:FAD-binding oxidoreductase [Bacteroidales bacterium]|nr:FAD-binding oxidoreductase [Bacteroidales bacterium]
MTEEAVKLYKGTVIEKRNITESTFVLSLDRNGMIFSPGQHIVVGSDNDIERREYSIYSGINNSNLEILVKEIEDGNISKKLNFLEKNDILEIEGPFGQFTINEHSAQSKKFLFIASGTGISPFHSFIKSYPSINYTMLHGIKHINETYDKTDYKNNNIKICTSRDKKGDFNGRVTDYLIKHPVKDFTNLQVYACGNSNMIYDAFDILKKQGMQSEQFFTEVYF